MKGISFHSLDLRAKKKRLSKACFFREGECKIVVSKVGGCGHREAPEAVCENS